MKTEIRKHYRLRLMLFPLSLWRFSPTLVVDLSAWPGERRGLSEVGHHAFCYNRFSLLRTREHAGKKIPSEITPADTILWMHSFCINHVDSSGATTMRIFGEFWNIECRADVGEKNIRKMEKYLSCRRREWKRRHFSQFEKYFVMLYKDLKCLRKTMKREDWSYFFLGHEFVR